MSRAGEVSATFFGKVPGRGDFVKGAGQHPLIGMLDSWVSGAMELISTDPGWKVAYDAACPVDFAFVGARSGVAVVGHLRPSIDASGRRFPFLAAAAVERGDTLMFRCAPCGLVEAWAQLARCAQAAVAGAAPAAWQGELEAVDCGALFDAAMQGDPLGAFVRGSTLVTLADLLGVRPEAVARVILAIGLLMRPVLGQPSSGIDKDLILPLPAEPAAARQVAGLWLYLVSAFLRGTALELQLLIPCGAVPAHFFIGFRGAAADTLANALVPPAATQAVSLVDPEWIDAQPALIREHGVARLASYLAQPGIGLELVVNSFREVFLGE
ncbi:MAG: type VI secretion system-associated protein TagF [Zoogloea sp.]|nr:type VI secretion system-associated protein TagF [Zoogloea sp.]